MAHSYTSNVQHIVFATKQRRRLIDPDLERELYPWLGGLCRNLGGQLIRINGDLDHVHLLTWLPPSVSIAEATGKMKGSSSKWVHDTFPRKKLFQWQRGYGAFSVSKSHIPTVAAYIDRQKEHHRRISFDDEFREILRLHEIELDPRFLRS